MDNNKPTTEEILEAIANNWDRLSKEEQDHLANLFMNHSAAEILIGIELLRGIYENKIN